MKKVSNEPVCNNKFITSWDTEKLLITPQRDREFVKRYREQH